ncbi:MAG: ADOP family duplicated permease [Bryobacteraceae bacterium]|jgi:predicted permease
MHPIRWAAALYQDLRFGTRLLARSPGFTAASVACLAIGIGVTASVGSELQSMVFRDLPAVRGPRDLVRSQTPMPYGDWEEFRNRSDAFASLAAFMGPVPFEIAAAGGQAERVWGQLVTPNYFRTLGVEPLAGRLFGVEEDRAGAASVAAISARYWRARFASSPSTVGGTIRVNGQLVTLIGVAPENFLGADPMLSAADIWIPATAPPGVAPELGRLRDRQATAFDLIGRLKPGRTPARAEASLEPIARRLEQIYDDPGKDRKEPRVILLPGGRIYPLRDQDLPKVVGLPVVLVGLVLLMACINVANMLVARAAARRREIAVRLSIGGSRARIVRQLLTESLLLAALGGAAGLGVVRWYMAYFASIRGTLPGYMTLDWRLDWRALVFSALLTLVSGLLFGLAPALNATRDDIASALKSTVPSRLRARRWFSLRNILVTNQIAASMVLLLLTGFIVIGIQRASSGDSGFDYKHLYLLSLDPVRGGYDAKRAADYFDKLPRRLARVPGIGAVSVAQTLPAALGGVESLITAKVEFTGGRKALGAIRSDRVGAGFFETLGIPVLRGRAFTERDIADGSAVLIVNETMAKQVWPGQDPVGQTLDFEGRLHQVIGVARDIRPPLPLGPSLPAVYQPNTPSGFGVPSRQGVTVAVRAQLGFDAAVSLRRQVEAIDAQVAVLDVRRMEDLVEQIYYMARVAAGVYGAMGVFALVLAAVGLAGVTAYSVARRTHEIGIRMALGASRRNILGLVLRESAALFAVGDAVGLVVALAMMRVLGSILDALAQATQTSASDPAILVGAPALLVGLALAACYIPARKAVRIDPAAALRSE